ncbi:unnamed protein product [Rotaria socialis]|uniref:Sodefrin-like factor n=1 Tax=Rotaria socialis TaxID=392032 RepID=A0A821ETF6_9BILA|nr:unnamed protein product [Rotaria socialis]CAF4641344.1 unnamed protein product [Rotaria socialis]
MMIRFSVLYFALLHCIQTSQTLECYSCSGGEQCGILFSPNSTKVKIVKSRKTDILSSCSISVTHEGLTTRSLVPSHECRSSSYQFCCNEDFCNTLASPPLPAFTSLKCDIGKCKMTHGICVYDADYVTTLSSATESCSITLGHETYKYYKKGCRPTIKESHVAQLVSELSKSDVFCCNSPECNTGHIDSAIKGVHIQCYTCDSRVNGLEGCMIFNKSSPKVYEAGSSGNREACATIIGLEGRDSVTGKTYPAFALRTFITDCVSQPLGYVSYGGAFFKGRIECCSSHFCNTKTLDTKETTSKLRQIVTIIIIIVVVAILLIFVAIAIASAVYLYRKKKDKNNYGPVFTKEPETSLDSLKKKVNKKPTEQPTIDSYPEESATP